MLFKKMTRLITLVLGISLFVPFMFSVQKTRKINKFEQKNILFYVPMYETHWISEKAFKYIKEADVDAILTIKPIRSNLTKEQYKEYVNLARKYDLKLYIPISDKGNELDMSDNELIDYARRYVDEDIVIGFNIHDEPSNANPWARVERVMKEAAPNKVPLLNFLPLTDENKMDDYLRLLQYNTTFLSYDLYPFGPTPGSLNEYAYFENLNRIRKVGLRNNTNTAAWVQSVGSTLYGYRRPDEHVIRYQISAGLAYGIKQFSYYSWAVVDHPEAGYTDAVMDVNYEPTDLYQPICKIHKDVHRIGETLTELDALSVYHTKKLTNNAYDIVPKDFFIQPLGDTNAIISVQKHRKTGRQYLILVNKDFKKNQTISFSLPGIDKLYELSKDTGELTYVTLINNELSIDLLPGDFRIYALDEGKDYLPTKEIKESDNLLLDKYSIASNSFGIDGWFINKANDGVSSSTIESMGWRTDSKTNIKQWIEFDLGKVSKLNRVNVYPARDKNLCGEFFPTGIEILVSNDRTKWTSIVKDKNVDRPTYDVPYYTFKEQNARYIKVVVTPRQIGSNFISEIAEIEAMYDTNNTELPKTSYESEKQVPSGTNVALNKLIVDSSGTTNVLEWSLHEKFLTDGKTGEDGKNLEAWSSSIPTNYDNPKKNEFVTIFLAGKYLIDRVILYPRPPRGNAFPKDFEVLVSVDGVNFTTVASVKSESNKITMEKRELTFTPIEAKYVKIQANYLTVEANPEAGYCMQLSELEVYTK